MIVCLTKEKKDQPLWPMHSGFDVDLCTSDLNNMPVGSMPFDVEMMFAAHRCRKHLPQHDHESCVCTSSAVRSILSLSRAVVVSTDHIVTIRYCFRLD